jgi:hypothetical protein
LLDKRRSTGNYFSGVGIGGRMIGNLLDGASGRGVFRTVRAAYTFVRGNFIANDKLFIFGFSRGACAARHLAGMIARIGIHHHTEVGYDENRRSLHIRISVMASSPRGCACSCCCNPARRETGGSKGKGDGRGGGSPARRVAPGARTQRVAGLIKLGPPALARCGPARPPRHRQRILALTDQSKSGQLRPR